MVDKTEKDKMKQLVREQISGDDGKLKWMYSSKTDSEEYLLGKRVDKAFERENELQKEVAAKSVGALFEDDVVAHNVKVDMQVKMREDPLFAIRKREEDARRALLMNPVKMKQLQKRVSSKDRPTTSESGAGGERREKRHHRSSSSGRSADELLRTYLSLLGKTPGGLPDAEEEEEASGGAQSVPRGGLRTGSPPPDDRSGRPPSARVGDDLASARSKETQAGEKKKKKAHSSDREKERKNKKAKKEKKKKSKKARRRSSSSSSGSDGSSCGGGDDLLQKYLSLTRGAPPSAMEASAGRTGSDPSAKAAAAEPGAGSGSDRLRQQEEEHAKGAELGGRRHEGRQRGRSRSPRAELDPGASRASSHHQERHGGSRKLTDEEKEARRQEMMQNAKWQEEERKKNLKKHDEEGKKEEEDLMQKGPKSAANFINPLMANHAQQSSVEDRLKRNRHHIQRTSAALDKNFSQR